MKPVGWIAVGGSPGPRRRKTRFTEPLASLAGAGIRRGDEPADAREATGNYWARPAPGRKILRKARVAHPDRRAPDRNFSLERAARCLGYILAIARLDWMGHRRLQLTGFAVMAACFLIIAAVRGLTTMVVPFLLVYGVSYFFTEFGPNMTTFVMPSELSPVSMRATGHGISAGVGKLGAFIGVFLFPVLQTSLGLRGTLLLTGVISAARLALTLVLPEPAGQSLDAISDTARPAAWAGPAGHRHPGTLTGNAVVLCPVWAAGVGGAEPS